ncbi:unnamed protein product [Arctogadus glacialis]
MLTWYMRCGTIKSVVFASWMRVMCCGDEERREGKTPTCCVQPLNTWGLGTQWVPVWRLPCVHWSGFLCVGSPVSTEAVSCVVGPLCCPSPWSRMVTLCPVVFQAPPRTSPRGDLSGGPT